MYNYEPLYSKYMCFSLQSKQDKKKEIKRQTNCISYSIFDCKYGTLKKTVINTCVTRKPETHFTFRL